jgi:hypothetical protein
LSPLLIVPSSQFTYSLQFVKGWSKTFNARNLSVPDNFIHFTATTPDSAQKLAREDDGPESGRLARWEERLKPWAEMGKMFKDEGFYERFPAKGEVERVARIHRELARRAGIEPRKTGRGKSD